MIYWIESEGRNETYYKIGYTSDSNFEKKGWTNINCTIRSVNFYI